MSRFFTIVSCILLLMSLSACRFGNQVQQKPSAPDPISGYYESNFDSMVAASVTTTYNEVNLDQTWAPNFLTKVMTNPVFLAYTDPEKHEVIIANAGKTSGITTTFDGDKQLSYEEINRGAPWLYSDCETIVQLLLVGDINKYSSPQKLSSGITSSGTLGLSLLYIMAFEGNCRQSLTEMAACYDSVMNCGGDDDDENIARRDAVKGLLSYFIDAGVVTSATMPDLTRVGFEVVYK